MLAPQRTVMHIRKSSYLVKIIAIKAAGMDNRREVFRHYLKLTTRFPQGVGNGEKIGHQGEVGDG